MGKLLAGGCSFTLGNELSDDIDGKTPSKKTWAYGMNNILRNKNSQYLCVAKGGLGNSGIARRVFNALHKHGDEIDCVVVMWSFLSRYDWAMPRNRVLEDTR